MRAKFIPRGEHHYLTQVNLASSQTKIKRCTNKNLIAYCSTLSTSIDALPSKTQALYELKHY